MNIIEINELRRYNATGFEIKKKLEDAKATYARVSFLYSYMCENAYPPDLLVTSGTLEQFKSELSALYTYGEAFKNRRIGAKDDLSMFPIWY